jgi:hypothetical protein
LTLKELLAVAALLFSISNTVLYVRSVFTGRTKPHAFTWGIWALISIVTCTAQLSAGAGPGAWPQGLNAVTCSFVMLLGIAHGDRSYARSDWAALGLALLSIPLWYATGTPLWSVLLLCVIDGAGFYPTFRKSWHKPHEEPAFPYLLWAFGSLVSIAAIEAYSVTTVAYPAFLSAINTVFVAMLAARRKARARD